MGRGRRTTVLLTSVAIAAVGGGGAVSALAPTPAQAAELPAFDSCSALQHWVQKAAADEARHPVFEGGVSTGGVGALRMAAGPVPVAATAPAAPASAKDAVGSSPTGTNVQEAGVDEPDQIKTNGHYVVGVAAGRLWVAVVSNRTPHVIGRLKLDGDASSLLLSGDRALAIVQPRVAYRMGSMPGTASGGPQSAKP